ncbi:hypothetical protein [Lichenibacterium dinghuense]|uniref:hypothetical protein n=1 Tax=Lichenibacterium dinghuense TaxID=2895977 RepID=UPI001F1B24DC|nr:hypothetical protein [Lichenibacterium sp. 6Y81]
MSDPKFYVSKMEIVEFHKTHTPSFSECQAAFGLVGRLQTWYSEMSAVVHGQVPGVWNAHSAIHEIAFSKPTHDRAVAAVMKAEQLSHEILLCTAGKELWSGIAPDAKLVLLKGIPGATKAALALDSK